MPVDDGGDHLFIPEEKAAISGIWVEHKAHPDIVAFAFHTVDPAPSAPEAHPFGFADADPIDGLIGAGGKGLSHCTLDVVGDPGDTGTFGVGVQIVFGKVMLAAQAPERLCSLQLFGAREVTGPLPGGIIPHASEPLVGFCKQSIIETPSRLQVSTYLALLAPVHPEWQFEEKSRCLGSLHAFFCLSMHAAIISLLTFPAVRENVERVHKDGTFLRCGKSSRK